jgi:RND family efflux transporter MFP subunit
MNPPLDSNGTSAPQRALEEHERLHPGHHEHHVDVGSAPPVKPASTSRVVAIAVGAAVVLAALLISAFLPRRAVTRELAADGAAQDSPPEVQVIDVVRAANGGDLVLPGTIQPLHESAIYARVGGYVTKWTADIGQVVRAGDVLAEIDAPELEQQVQQASQQLAQTHASLGLAKADLARWKTLAADSAVSREEYDQKSAAYDAATANSGAAEANLRRLTEMQRYTKVTAPFAGVITARNIDIGSLISAAGATNAPVSAGGTLAQSLGSLFRIAQTDTVRTYVSVPQTDALSMASGVTADVSVQEIPNRTFPGRVARTSGSIDPSSRTLLTEVDIVNPGMALLSGMYAQVHLHLAHTKPSLLVPATALLVRSNGPQVAVVDRGADGQPGTVHFQSVIVGRDLGGAVELRSGVSEGASVVANPGAELNDGMRVQVAAAAPATPRAVGAAPAGSPAAATPVKTAKSPTR